VWTDTAAWRSGPDDHHHRIDSLWRRPTAVLAAHSNNADINDLPLNAANYQYLLSLRPGVMVQPAADPGPRAPTTLTDESAGLVDGCQRQFYDARPVTGASSFITDAASIRHAPFRNSTSRKIPRRSMAGSPRRSERRIRSGTNTLHGSAYAFGRKDSGRAQHLQTPRDNGICVPNASLPRCM